MSKIPFNNDVTIIVPFIDDAENRRESNGNLVAKNNKFGAIFTRPDTEFLPRRLPPPTLGLKFYDLGQLLIEEVWTDKFFSADANIHQSGNSIITDNISPTDTAAKAQFYLNFIQNLIDEANGELEDPDLFPDGPPDNPAPFVDRYVTNGVQNAFKKIQKSNANKFYLRVRSVALNTYFTLDADSARWTSDGKAAKFEDSELAQGININTSPFFPFMRIGQNANPFTAKVTSEPSFDSEEIIFNVGKSDIYFLVPAFCNISNFETGVYYPTTDRADIFVDAIQYTFVETLYANYLTFPRILMDALLADWFAVNFNVNKTLATQTLATYNLFYQNSEFLKGKAGTRFFKLYQGRKDNGMGGTSPLNVMEEKVLADYPFASIYPAPSSLPHYEYKDDDVSVQIEPNQYLASWGATSNSGALLAIIKQGNDWFYAWER